jgi:predicted nucleotidyltransferase
MTYYARLQGKQGVEIGSIDMGTIANIQFQKKRIEQFCTKYHIGRLSFFGSVLRQDFRPDSDVDVLVEFLPGRRVGYFRMAEMELALSDILGRKADLRTPAELSRYFRDEVMVEAEVQYVES